MKIRFNTVFFRQVLCKELDPLRSSEVANIFVFCVVSSFFLIWVQEVTKKICHLCPELQESDTFCLCLLDTQVSTLHPTAQVNKLGKHHKRPLVNSSKLINLFALFTCRASLEYGTLQTLHYTVPAADQLEEKIVVK